MIHELPLQALFLKRYPYVIPELRLFRRQVHVARAPSGAKIRAGITGQADLYGYLRGGRGVEVELKSVTAVTTPEQLQWEAWCRQWGVLYARLRARKGETEGETVDRWCEELRSIVKA